MAKINTHGLKMTGLKKVSGQTLDYGDYSPRYLEIFYDVANGNVWGIYQYKLGQLTWTEYHSASIIKIGNTTKHWTMQELADFIAEVVEERKAYLN